MVVLTVNMVLAHVKPIRNSQLAITFCDGDERFRLPYALPFLGMGRELPKFVKNLQN
jgi:hypothetical protein